MLLDNSVPRAQRACRLVFALLLGAFLLTPASAFAGEEGWRLRLSAMYVDPKLDFTATGSEGQSIRARQDTDIGLAFRGEYQFSRRFGVELGVATASNDLTVQVENSPLGSLELGDALRTTSWTGGLLLHLTPERRVDLYVAGRLSYFTFGDIVLQHMQIGRQIQDADSDFGWSLALGADIALRQGSPWAAHFELAYVDQSLDLTNRDDGFVTQLSPDPILIHAGLSYRF